MIVSRRNLFALFFFITVTLTAQQQYSASEIVERVQKKYAQMNDASASFTQTVSVRFGKNAQTQHGTVKIKKGNKYRVMFAQQLLVTDGKTVWIYSSDNQQVLIDSYKENDRTLSPDKFLLGFPKDFTPTNVDEIDGEFVVSLAPSESNSRSRHITSLTMWVRPEQWIVNKVEYTDRNQTRSTIILSNITFNQGVADKEFRFEPTGEMKVIDLRKLK